jgi:membrane-associated phospholipid phosphatase
VRLKRTTLALALGLASPGLLAQTTDRVDPASPLTTQDFAPLPPLEGLGDGRRTMGRFVPNLGRNLAGVMAPRNARLLGLGVTAAGMGSMLDHPTKGYFSLRPRAQGFGEFGQKAGGAKVMAPLALGLFVAGRASHDTRFRAATYDLAQSMLVSQAYTTGIKLSVGRTRPDGSNRLSFPSGHTASAFTFAAVAEHHYGRRVGVAAYTAAGLIGLSRMERNKHHVSDVLAGAVLGILSARTVIHQNGAPVPDRRQLSLTPVAAPSGAGVGLGVSLSF